MREEGRALPPEAEGVPVDGEDDPERLERVKDERARERETGDRPALERQRRAEEASVRRALAPHGDLEVFAGLGEAPLVLEVHVHEGRDVEVLLEADGLAGLHDVGVPLAPRRVVDLRDDGVDPRPRRVPAVVEAHRVEDVAERAELREDADRSRGPRARPRLDEVSHRLVERDARIAEVVGAAEPRDVRPPRGPEPAAPEHRLDLVELEVDEDDPVLEAVLHGRAPPVPDASLVEAAPHATSSVANDRATASPLLTPSSWKP